MKIEWQSHILFSNSRRRAAQGKRFNARSVVTKTVFHTVALVGRWIFIASTFRIAGATVRTSLRTPRALWNCGKNINKPCINLWLLYLTLLRSDREIWIRNGIRLFFGVRFKNKFVKNDSGVVLILFCGWQFLMWHVIDDCEVNFFFIHSFIV